MKKIQLGLFDIQTPKIPPPEPRNNNAPALLNFFEDIDGKKTLDQLGQWRMKHQPRINRLTPKQQETLNDYYKKRKEQLK